MTTMTNTTDTLITTRTTRAVAPRNARKGYTLEELYELVGCSTVESELAGQPIVGDALYCKASRVK